MKVDRFTDEQLAEAILIFNNNHRRPVSAVELRKYASRAAVRRLAKQGILTETVMFRIDETDGMQVKGYWHYTLEGGLRCAARSEV